MLRIVGEESVLINVRTGVYFGADPVATQMWGALAGSETIQAAFDSILAEYEVDHGQLRDDLEKFLQKLLEYELIEIKPCYESAREKDK